MSFEEMMPATGDEEPRIFDRRASQGPAAEEGAADAPVTVEDLTRQLNEEKEKAQSFYASWQRAAADYQNFKRRVDQEKDELTRFASMALIINVLPIMDDLDRALQNVDAALAGLTWVEGIRLIYRKFQGLLDAAAVKEIDADGADFDPNQHEAVAFGPGEDGKIVSVIQKGYSMGGRVIRPAMVVVGKRDQGGAS